MLAKEHKVKLVPGSNLAMLGLRLDPALNSYSGESSAVAELSPETRLSTSGKPISAPDVVGY